MEVRHRPNEADAARHRGLHQWTFQLRGRQFWSRRTEEDLKKAVSFFEKALDIDPNYARAYVGLADSYAALALLEFMPPIEAYPKAREAVRKALALNAGLAAAHTSLGLIKFQYDWDWKGAEEEFRESISNNFNYAPAHHFFADYLKAMGRFEEALAEIEKARELDAKMEESMKGLRPDVLGSVTAVHPENGRYTTAIYFTSEAEARVKEKEMENSEEFQKSMQEWQAISDGEPVFYDLTEPWFSTR